MRIFGPTSLFSNAWSPADPSSTSPKNLSKYSPADFFCKGPKQGPETILILEFHGKKYEILIYGETTPDLLENLRIKLELYAKVFGADFLKAASEGQGPLEPRLRIYLAKNLENYSEVLEKDIGYGEKEAKEKALATSGIFYFEKNAIVIQCDLPNFPDTLTHEIAHYVDDLLKPRSNDFFSADDDMFSAHQCARLHSHYRERKMFLFGPHDYRGFPSRYGAHGDEGKCYVFEWFAENIKFVVDHFENPAPPEVPDTWINNDINSLALWTQGKGFASVAHWQSPNRPAPTPPPLSENLQILTGTSTPPTLPPIINLRPNSYRPPPVFLRDDFDRLNVPNIFLKVDWFRLECLETDIFNPLPYRLNWESLQPEIFRFHLPNKNFSPLDWYLSIDPKFLEFK